MADPVSYRTEVGYEFPVFDIVVSEAEQRRLHGHCGIGESLYGRHADPTFVAREPITLNTQTILANHPDHAPVHIVHRIEQRRPIRLGETLKMAGRVTAIAAHPRGRTLTTRWAYRDAAGETVFVVTPDVLMIDPARASGPSGGKSTPPDAAAPDSAPTDSGPVFETLTRKRCTPETTLGYCEGSTNKIHLDPETAQSFGFRAPIIAGNQTINFLMEGVCRHGLPQALSVEARFLRPVFWDDAIDVEGRKEIGGRLAEIRAVNAAGRTVADLRVLEAGQG